MSDGLRKAAEYLEVVVASAIIAVTVLGITVMPLLSPQYVRWRVAAGDSAERTGLGEEATLEAAEAVRVFVVDEDAPALPSEIDGVPAFDEAAVEHLLDVRAVVLGARWMTILLCALGVAWAVVRARGARGRETVRSALRSAAWLLVLGLATATVVGLTSFGALFTWFHGLFFEAGTWTFPDDALLIRVFPLPFWTDAAGGWTALVLAGAVLLFIAGRRSRFTQGT
jgi:integral membrane protein (TIGR01906 family)